jgi:hypothetical protein
MGLFVAYFVIPRILVIPSDVVYYHPGKNVMTWVDHIGLPALAG